MRDAIARQAKQLGFDAIGICAPEIAARDRAAFLEFVASGHHGDMAWMEAHAERRADPRALWPEVKSVIMLAHNYAPPENPLPKLTRKSEGVISSYALSRDYHDVIKKKLKTLARHIVEQAGAEVKVFVDTAPILEKSLAQSAGLGWQGKHTCLVSREFGGWLFLGEIFTTLELPFDTAEPDHCGSCTRCLDICPTQAFTAPGKLDARRCIAYLTIEHKGQIPEEFREAIGNRVYGCDDCIAVCPWNKFATTSQEAAYHARAELASPPLSMLLALDDAAFRSLFSGSPVKRVGRDRFVRNVLVAAGNSHDASLLPQVAALKEDASELVREMAHWACTRLAEIRANG